MVDHKPDRTARTPKALCFWALSTKPEVKLTNHAKLGRAALVLADQWKPTSAGPNTVPSMHGCPEPHPGAPRSTIPVSSSIAGSRQSQCPAKHPLVAVPSLLVPLFSVPRKSVNAVPFGVVPPTVVFHVYGLSLSCTLPSSVFCSHWSPVS